MPKESSLRTPAEKARTAPEINEADPQQYGKSLLGSINYFLQKPHSSKWGFFIYKVTYSK